MSSHRRQRKLRPGPALIALSILTVVVDFAVGQDVKQGVESLSKPVAERGAGPLEKFARMMPGSWRKTVQSGTSTFDTWHWGPGRYSLRVVTEGLNAVGKPWRELQVLYWDASRKQIRVLSLHPDVPGVGPGVGEGTIRLEGERADAVYDLHQPRGLRKMGLRWEFDGPDKYHATLLEATGAAGFSPLAEWDYFRVETRPSVVEEVPRLSDRLKALEPLLGKTWEARGEGAGGDVFQSTFEWVPYASYVYARVLTRVKAGESRHSLDAYLYHHVGTRTVRCLALSDVGGVYEGELTAPDVGSLRLDLKGHEGDRDVGYVACFNFEADGAVHHRVWSTNGTKQTLSLDLHLRALRPTQE